MGSTGAALDVQVTAYRDFTSCAAYASYVKSLGGTAKQAANCVNNLRRVLLVSELVLVACFLLPEHTLPPSSMSGV